MSFESEGDIHTERMPTWGGMKGELLKTNVQKSKYYLRSTTVTQWKYSGFSLSSHNGLRTVSIP